MTHIQHVLLDIQSVASIVVLAYICVERIKGRRERQKYKIFSMRDKLLSLVAKHRVSESDPLFKLLYKITNKSIDEVKDLTLISFIKASIGAQVSLEKKQEFDSMVNKATPEMREFVVEFASTWMDIMKANSVFLMLIVHIGRTGVKILKTLTRPRWFHTRIFQAQRQEVYTYQFFEDLHDCHG